ncbi:MAG: helix-turn-helix domain-containing protein [Ancrocorticia sp.]
MALHAFEGISLFHVASPLLVFGEVTRLGLASDWTIEMWSDDGATIHTTDGVEFTDMHEPDHVAEADLLVFPSWPNDLPEPGEPVKSLIRNAHERGATVAGLCLGAFPVAASGLLDGRTATTHWLHADTLAERYPAVQVSPDPLYIDHGDVLTSAGTASALDACLHIVRERLGAEAASTIARRAVVAPHREGGQTQFIDKPVPTHQHDSLGETLDWALANLDQPLDVRSLAAHANMSVRHFTRRFKETIGTTPARWVLSCRLDEARHLLETTAWSIEKVACASGFVSAVTFRQNFVAQYGTTPTSYRMRFAVA